MILADHSELRPLLDLDGLTADLMLEAWKINKIPSHFLWIDFDKIEEVVAKYAIEHGWNPDTTLVMFTKPLTEAQQAKLDAEEEAAKAAGEPIITQKDLDDWDIQIGSLNDKQCVCSLYQDMTLQKMADMINQVNRMKAFL